jgi:hypothetical protein
MRLHSDCRSITLLEFLNTRTEARDVKEMYHLAHQFVHSFDLRFGRGVGEGTHDRVISTETQYSSCVQTHERTTSEATFSVTIGDIGCVAASEDLDGAESSEFDIEVLRGDEVILDSLTRGHVQIRGAFRSTS